MSSTRSAPRAWVRAASLFVWAGYVVLPVDGWGLFPGRPLGLLPTAALAAVCWLAFARRTPLPWRAVAMALTLKVILGMTAVTPHGFAARYYANPEFAGPAERGTEPTDASFTRIDHRLRFGVGDQPDVPLAFFNDEQRFNFYRENDPDRAQLPFSVTWQGFWRVTSQRTETLYLVSPSGSTEMNVGGVLSVRVPAGARWTGVVTLPPGLHRVTIAWSVPPGGARQFDAGWIVDGTDRPFDDESIVRRRESTVAAAVDWSVRAASRLLDAAIVVWMLIQVVTVIGAAYRRLRSAFDPRDVLTLIWAAGIGDALVAALPMLDRMITLSGGNDWLTYETHARDIGLHGLWMNGGAALGHGGPFFQQPLYPYFLAACHWISGDDLFGVYFVQRLFVTATIVALWRTTARLFDEPRGLAALVTAGVIVFEKFAPWSGIMLTETLFVPLVCFWLYAIVRFIEAPSQSRAIGAGLVGGLATLARSSLLLGWIGVVPALALAVGRRRRPLGLLAILLTAMIAVVSVATIRNWIVARQLVAISSEGPVVLFVGNSPPPLPIPPSYQALYTRAGLDPMVQAVVEYARQQPRSFGRGLWRKAQYTLGWFEAIRPQAGTSLFYIVTWAAALIGVAFLRWTRPARPLAIVLIPLIVAASHFAVVVLFQPHVYGDRLVMPLYMLLVPYAAIPAMAIARVAVCSGRGRAATVTWALLCLVLIARLLGNFSGLDLDVFAAAALIAGLCLAGVPELCGFRVAIYAAYAVTLAIWLVRSPDTARGVICRWEWLFLAIALFSDALLPGRAARRLARSLLLGSAALAAIWLSLHASYADAIRALTSHPLPFAGVALWAAVGGLCTALAALAIPARAARSRRLLACAAGSAIALGALRQAGTLVNPDRALLAGRIAAFGAVGAIAYAMVWIEGAWPDSDSVSGLATRGLVAGALIATLFGVDLNSGQAEALLLAGLAIGASRRQALRVAPDARAPA